MRTFFFFTIAGLLICFSAGCSNPWKPDAASTPAAATSAATPAYADTGTLFRPTTTIKDIMDSEVQPSADYIWDSVSTIITEKGIEDRQPRTPAEWLEIRRKAVTLVEATNLIVMPGRIVARPGDKSENPGIELSPEEINAILEKSRPTFIEHAHQLHDEATKMLAAIDAKDVMAILDSGAALDEACEGCHLIYWYPNEGKGRVAPSLRKQ